MPVVVVAKRNWVTVVKVPPRKQPLTPREARAMELVEAMELVALVDKM